MRYGVAGRRDTAGLFTITAFSWENLHRHGCRHRGFQYLIRKGERGAAQGPLRAPASSVWLMQDAEREGNSIVRRVKAKQVR
jgi:hypothetical protein